MLFLHHLVTKGDQLQNGNGCRTNSDNGLFEHSNHGCYNRSDGIYIKGGNL